MKKEKMQEYIMHNYKQNIHIGDVKSIKSKRGKWDFYENCFVKMWISGVKSVSVKDICTRDKNITTCETKPLLK